MTFEKVYEKLELKFTSGNQVPVERTVITKEEWNEIKEYVDYLEKEIHKWILKGKK